VAQSKVVSEGLSPTLGHEENLIGVITDATRRRGLKKKVYSIRVTDKSVTRIPEAEKGEKPEPATRIELDQIKSVSLTLGRSYKNCCGNYTEENGSLEIVSTTGKYGFSLPPARAEKADGILRRAKLIR